VRGVPATGAAAAVQGLVVRREVQGGERLAVADQQHGAEAARQPGPQHGLHGLGSLGRLLVGVLVALRRVLLRRVGLRLRLRRTAGAERRRGVRVVRRRLQVVQVLDVLQRHRARARPLHASNSSSNGVQNVGAST
jgi:hypothetical protein